MCPGSPEASGLEVPQNPLKRVGFLFLNLVVCYQFAVKVGH